MVVESSVSCPSCGASWPDGRTCEEQFHALLFLEHANPTLAYPGHHLLVMCYMLQHNGYSEEARRAVISMLEDVLEHDLSTAQLLHQNREQLAATERTFKITGSAGSDTKIDWPLTIMDIDNQDAVGYIEHVTAWARSVLATLRASEIP